MNETQRGEITGSTTSLPWMMGGSRIISHTRMSGVTAAQVPAGRRTVGDSVGWLAVWEPVISYMG